MLIQNPLFGSIIALFTVVLVITESILKERVLKNRLILSFFNLAAFVVLIFLFDQHIGQEEPYNTYQILYIVYQFFNYLIFLFMLYGTFKNAIINASQYQLFVKGIKNTKWNVYYVVDQREKIKDMSLSLLRELNMEKEDVIGKKLFQVFSQAIRFTKFNGEDANNRTLEKYFIEYKKTAKPSDSEEQEISFLNFTGETIILHLSMQPIFVLGKYRGRMCVGEKRTDEDLMKVEKVLKQTDSELESIRHKFIATLELSDEGLFSMDLDEKTIWLNDTLVDQLQIASHTLSLTDYRSLIEPNDLQKYLAALSGLTMAKDSYQTSYRLMIRGNYVWMKEKGKRLFEDKNSAVIMGIITPMYAGHFRKSNIDVLDEIKDENYLSVDLKNLIKTQRPFQLAILRLANVPQINEKHGRDIGNMVMGHYINKIKQSFITESSDIYRLSGLEFALTITDPRKMGALKNGLRAEENHLNLSIEYGAIQVELEVFIGIAEMHTDAVNAMELYQNSMRALKTALNPQYKGNSCYYKDIK